ncbi:MAG: hypothetical protein RL323_2356 [Pseudomonadota bacterium]
MWNRRRWLTGMGALGLAATGCQRKAPQALRVGAQTFPGYEFVYLARELRLFSDDAIRLIEVPNATSSIRALGSQSMEGACLTLDEVLTARERGIALTIVAVLDFSNGADALMARPDIKDLKNLKGRKVGVEKTALGAVMLDAALEKAGLSASDVSLTHAVFDEHEDLFSSGKVDALVTYEPLKSKLLKQQAVPLFSSADVPGLILDTIAIRTEALDDFAGAIRQLVSAHFQARDAWMAAPAQHAPLLAQRLQLGVSDIPEAYAELELPDRAGNQTLLAGRNPPLLQTARKLGDVMVKSGLLRDPPQLDRLLDPRFIG